MTLDEIAIQQGADKASRHPVKGHNYCVHYAKWFEPLRHDSLKVMEIGVGGGESIRTWIDYFPNARVYGVDKVHSTNPWNTVASNVHSRYTFVAGDQSDETLWKCFKADYGSDWDIIIDDGGHYINHIVPCFKALWPMLKPGGLYCVEDLAVAYGGTMFVPAGWINHMDWIKDKLDQINREDVIDSMYYAKELAIIKKA